MEFPFVNILFESVQNGIGAFVFGILLYLALYHFFLFVQRKKRYYLLYSLFAFLNGLQLFGVLKNVFFESLFEHISFRNSPLFYCFRTLSFVLFGMFIMEITNTRIENPRFYKSNYQSIYFTIPLIVIFLTVDYYQNTKLSYFLFQYLFFPLFSVITIIAIPIMLNFKTSIKYYLLGGVVTYNLLIGIMYFLIWKQGLDYENRYMFLFFIALLVENSCFTLALGKKERELFEEKNKIQQDYIIQLNENQKIKQELNSNLEKKVFQKTKELEKLSNLSLQQEKDKLQLEFENLKHKIQVESLQNQMNPHFIFNALNSIKAYLVENDTKNGIFYINKFSKLIRGILDGLREEAITLVKEIELLEIYIRIESIRIKDDIEFVVQNKTSLDFQEIKLPPLLLQPIIENAIHHGFSKATKKKKIEIIVSQYKGLINIMVVDNGVGFSDAVKDGIVFKNSYGLRLVEERLDVFNNNSVGKEELIHLENTSDGFTRASICIRIKN